MLSGDRHRDSRDHHHPVMGGAQHFAGAGTRPALAQLFFPPIEQSDLFQDPDRYLRHLFLGLERAAPCVRPTAQELQRGVPLQSLFLAWCVGRGMSRRQLGLGVGIGFVRPLRQNFLGQLKHLLAHPLLGFIGGAIVVAHGCLQRVGQLMQSFEHFRTVRQSLFQGAA